MDKALLVIFYFGVPLLLTVAKRSFSIVDKIGVVTLCYLAGILIGNMPGVYIDGDFTHEIVGPVIMLAIPLLLFGTRISTFKSAGPAILRSFLLCIVAVTVMATLATILFASHFDAAWQVGAMTFGVYTGGTVNLSAIGLALDADENTITLLNAADLLWGGILLLFLLTAAKKMYQRFLPSKEPGNEPGIIDSERYLETGINPRGGILSFLAAVIIVGTGIGLSLLVMGKVSEMVMYLIVTTFGILASLSPAIHNLKGSYAIGDYLINTFCVMIGSLANVQTLIDQGGIMVGFIAVVMFGSLVLHLLLARLFRIGPNPVIVASAAGLYGPPFVPPIARAIGAPQLIPIGITLSLVGFAVGNYGGIALGQLFRQIFG